MQVSAEIRWFWPNLPPAGLRAWFCEAGADWCAAGGGNKRIDEYLSDPGQAELGIKRRGGKSGVEIKGLVSVVRDGLAQPPFAGSVEIWTKWTSERLDLGTLATIGTTKRRWLRKFDSAVTPAREVALYAAEKPLEGRLPDEGCNVELTEVTLPGGPVWWTLGFEAFGSIETVRHSLAAAAERLSERRPPSLERGFLASYPAWLGQYAHAN